MRLSRVIITCWGIAMLALPVSYAVHAAPPASSVDAVPPLPPPPGGPMSHHFGPPPPPSKAAFFHFHRGDIDIDIKCADEESLKTCSEASNTLLDKALAATH